MNIPPPIPTPIPPPTAAFGRAIRYELTRVDLFVNLMTVIFRNRLLQIFIPVAMIATIWTFLSGPQADRTIEEMVVRAILYIIGYIVILALTLGLFGSVQAFLLPQKGVVGEHILEITDIGLVERTAFNESLHKWPSISRIFSFGGYLFIYVGESNCYYVPKRGFQLSEIREFESELRVRSGQARR